MKKFLLSFFCLTAFALAQTPNPTGTVYQLSGNGSQVQMTNGTGTAGSQPCYDSNGNLTPTCSTAATGLGVYLFASGQQDTGCVQILASDDGKLVRPMTWPLDPFSDASFCGGGLAGYPIGTNGAGGMFSFLYLAPWNSTYYLIYNDATNSNSVGVASSPDLLNWTVVGDAYVNGGLAGYSNAAAASIFYDAPAQCPNQDFTCLHVIVPIVYTSTGNYTPMELHPTNSSLSAWSTAVQLASGVVTNTTTTWSGYMLNYGGTYYLYWLQSVGGGMQFNLYSASTITGTYTLVGNLATAWCGTSPCTTGNSVEDISIIWTGTAWRAYLHPAQNVLGEFYVVENSSPIATTGWTAPNTTQTNGLIDAGSQLASVMRTADPKTISIVAAAARQSVLPLFTTRGLSNCDRYSTTFNTPGQGGPWNGICAGMEHLSQAQQGQYQGIRILAENPSKVYTGITGSTALTGHIDFGSYLSLCASVLNSGCSSNPAFNTWFQMGSFLNSSTWNSYFALGPSTTAYGPSSVQTYSSHIDQPYTNASSGGATANHIAKLNGTSNTVAAVLTTDTEAVGIVDFLGSGDFGTGAQEAYIAIAGTVPCVFSNASTSGHYVQISATTATDCVDAGATVPTSGGTILGRVADGGAAGLHSVSIALTPPIGTTGSGPCTTTAGSLQYDNGSAFGCVTPFTTAGATITSASGGVLNMSGATATTGWRPPAAAGAAPVTAGVEAFDTTQNTPVFGDGTLTHHVNPTRSISFEVGVPGSGTALTTGILGYLTIPFPCTISGWSMQADAENGTITVKTLKVATGTAIPTLGSNSISTSGVSLTTGTVVQSTTVTDFTSTAVSKNDIVAVDVITMSSTNTDYLAFQLICTQ